MSHTSALPLILAAALSVSTLAASAAPASADGINQLIAVQQLKAQTANEEAAALDRPADQAAVSQQRITLTTDRKAKGAATMSNVSKKFSDTQSGIAQNLK